MAFELTDENKESVLNALTEKGFKVLDESQQKEFESSYEALKKSEIKEIWDKVDSTIYDITKKDKLIREDNGRERTVDYYQRVLKESLDEKKTAAKQVEEYKKSLEEVQAQYEALKSDNPELKYEEKFKELTRKLKEKDEELNSKLSEKESEFSRMIFENNLSAVFDSLRPHLKSDVPYVEDIIESKKRMIAQLESKTMDDGKQVFYKDGQPLLNEDGSFKSVSDIARTELISLFDESKVKEGIGGDSQKANTKIKQFGSKEEVDAFLNEKYQKIGSREWIQERSELLAASGLK